VADPTLDPAAPPPAVVDLDLRGSAVVRLVDAGARELRAIRRQLGPLPARDRPAETEPDLTVRFVDRLERRGPVRRIGAGAQLVDGGFIVTRGNRQSEVRVEVPVGELGSVPTTIVVERGGTAIPFLLPMLAAGLLARGIATAHASAFLVDGRGVFVSGWAKGGKSETLLAFLTHGARYVGDEWLFVDPTGPTMFGPPEPIRLWDWQLAQVETVRRAVGGVDRLRLVATGGLSRMLNGVGRAGPIGHSSVGEAARRAGAVVDRQRSRQFAVDELFGASAIHAAPATIDRVVLVAAASEDAVRTGVDPAEAAARVAATTAHELLDLEALRLAYRHAVPGAPTPGLEMLEARLSPIYARAFADVPIIEVRHRHPPDIANLYRLIAPAL
jgi:hypothetical protein